MCGIVGYLGKGNAVPILLDGLRKLEYRGYDSAGIAILNDNHLRVTKREGRLDVLQGELGENLPLSHIGIGHTRWATHGRPCDRNSHPHQDCTGKFAVVHNGIIENYQQLRNELAQKGHRFNSDTDTEIFAHLVEEYYEGSLLEAVRRAEEKVEGSYAVVAMTEHEPDRLVAVRRNSPLIVGIGDGEYFFASDIPAVLDHTRKIQIIEDGETVVLDGNGISIFNGQKQVTRDTVQVNWDSRAAEKGGYPHFMLKEIFEQPRALRDTVHPRINEEKLEICLDEVNITAQQLKDTDRVFIAACGTAYHAGLIGKYAIESLARIPVEIDLASEFRYKNPMVTEKSLLIVVSQSGETADTLAALRLAKEHGARVLAVTNVVGSSVAREADDVLFTWAGPEIAVASTKAYVTQLAAMFLIAGHFAELLGTVSKKEIAGLVSALNNLPDQVAKILEQKESIEQLAVSLAANNNCFFIGRGMDYAVAMEGSLKLKEISYMHAEAYAAGELKHGTLALIEEGTPVIGLVTQDHVYEKTVSNIEEVIARDAQTIVVTYEGDDKVSKIADSTIFIPNTVPLVAPILAVVPLQLLAYYAAVHRGCDVDKPRNLAKSVTVE
ncbi:MAG: glutamine--fructose-6-phosphate transaminase (isomerizing) [Bacillota bacterium]|jgi:glucosamine--fructose-6-phosphate aminotransferase (isomerizing)